MMATTSMSIPLLSENIEAILPVRMDAVCVSMIKAAIPHNSAMARNPLIKETKPLRPKTIPEPKATGAMTQKGKKVCKRAPRAAVRINCSRNFMFTD